MVNFKRSIINKETISNLFLNWYIVDVNEYLNNDFSPFFKNNGNQMLVFVAAGFVYIGVKYPPPPIVCIASSFFTSEPSGKHFKTMVRLFNSQQQ